MSMYELTVILPTLNEAETIRETINKVMRVLEDNHLFGEVLIVDDNSTDNSLDIFRDLQAIYKNLTVLIRFTNPGLSQSVYNAFEEAQSDVFIVMDADGQHPAEKILELYRGICEGNDIVIGSRYMNGGGIEKWSISRRIISIGANVMAQLFFPEVSDTGSGFFAIKKGVIEGAVLKPRGYKILVEILGKGQWESVKEIPILFGERKKGESKLKGFTMMEYLRQLSDLFWFSINHKDSHAFGEFTRIAKFMAVGLTGVFVNMGFLYVLTEKIGMFYLVSSIFAIELSILSNFALNDLWTFGDVDNRHSGFSRFIRFHVVSISGVIINIATLFILTAGFGVYYLLSNLIGIGLAFAWNFLVNRRLTWIRI
jgi:dolichol-phosphate mannosyltransferase